MTLYDLPVRDTRPLIAAERAALLELLMSLSTEDWSRPTPCPGWSVKDVALHILDDDLGWLSRDRDADDSGRLFGFASYRDFVDALTAKNQRWVEATRVLSPRVIVELLEGSGVRMQQWYSEQDLTAEGSVAWTGPEPVPNWFDIAQDLTEFWVHQQQIREAVARPGLLDEAFLGEVLTTFLWALPHHYRDLTGPDASMAVTVTGPGGGLWLLRRRLDRWDLVPEPSEADCLEATATVVLTDRNAWKLLTGGLEDPPAVVTVTGDQALTTHLLGARAIII